MANIVIKTPEARLSFASLMSLDKKGKYSACLLFKKGENLDALKKAVEDVLKDRFGDKSKWPKGLRSPFRDQGEKEYAGYEEGATFINVRSKNKPLVIDQRKNDILDEEEVYSGAYVYASVTPFFYDMEGNKGVAFGLNGVQKIRNGEPLGGAGVSKDAFEVLEGGVQGDLFD